MILIDLIYVLITLQSLGSVNANKNIHSEAVKYITDLHLTKDFYGLFKIDRNSFDVKELKKAYKKIMLK